MFNKDHNLRVRSQEVLAKSRLQAGQSLPPTLARKGMGRSSPGHREWGPQQLLMDHSSHVRAEPASCPHRRPATPGVAVEAAFGSVLLFLKTKELCIFFFKL